MFQNSLKLLHEHYLHQLISLQLEDVTIIADGMLQFPSISIFPSDRNAFRLIPVHANNAINETIDETIENDLHGHKSTPAATGSIELDYHRSIRCIAHAVKFNRDTIGNGLFENKLGIPSGMFACLVIGRSSLLITCFVFGSVFLFILVTN